MRCDALKRAIEAAGGVRRLGALVGVTGQAVSQWGRVPAGRVLAVEAATNGAVTRHDLRPDIFGPPPRGDETAALTSRRRR